jgi:uncharacterized protein (DUF983 family)
LSRIRFENEVTFYPVTTLMLFLTSLAGAKVSLPAWLAVTEHVPTLIKVSVKPSIVQIKGVVVAKVTESRLVEDALKAKVPVDRATDAGALKVMV